MTPGDTYSQLVALLDQHGAQYRLIDHAPEGRTEIVSPMRGNALSQAAKCIVLMVKLGKKVTKYVLGVVPGDARVDLNAVKAIMQAPTSLLPHQMSPSGWRAALWVQSCRSPSTRSWH